VGTPERDLCDRTLGAIGLGHIGSHVVALARALGMRAVAVTRSPSPERAEQHGLEWLGGLDSLPRLLRESDFALVCVPLTPETTGLIGPRELELLGPDSYLLNVARGPVVDESALYVALREGTIAGAAIDVWYRYPREVGERTMPASFPFWELENVVMTPHSAGWSESTVRTRWQFVADQLVRLREGRPLENVLWRG
jgi:phosphoglycerate dehydrogenase-like enzyme